MTYYGGNDTTRLYYDGHPGIDYHAAMQTQVYAAVTGTIHYPDRIVGLSSGSDFHVMAIIPDHAGGSEPPYLIYYLHLYTYVGQTPTPATDPDPLPGCQGTVSLPLAEGWHVQAGCLVALSGNTSPYTKPLPPHLHFEVHEVVPTATVSKTSGAQNATLCVDNAIGTGFNCVPVDPYGWCTLSQCPATSPDPYFSSTGIANMTLWQ
jgi:murein DD-endopeptidase MepM/ murein hydrolase activator NlpD